MRAERVDDIDAPARCPQCDHEQDQIPDLTGRIHRWVRVKLGKPAVTEVRLSACREGASYDWDGCGCADPFHSA